MLNVTCKHFCHMCVAICNDTLLVFNDLWARMGAFDSSFETLFGL